MARVRRTNRYSAPPALARWGRWPVILFLAGLALVAASCGTESPTEVGQAASATEAASASPPILDPQEIAAGRELYATHCAECHGDNLEGEVDWKEQNEDGSFRAPPHDASGHTWHHGDKNLIEAIILGGARLPEGVGGTSNMPAFGDILTANEIAAVLTFIKSTWPDDIRAIQWQQSVRET